MKRQINCNAAPAVVDQAAIDDFKAQYLFRSRAWSNAKRLEVANRLMQVANDLYRQAGQSEGMASGRN